MTEAAVHAERFNELLRGLSALQMSGKYSDITLVCQSRQWALHKVVLASRSGYFDDAISGSSREASTAVIDMSEEDESDVDGLIRFFYYLDYETAQDNLVTDSFPPRTRREGSSWRLARNLSVVDPLFTQALDCETRAQASTELSWSTTESGASSGSHGKNADQVSENRSSTNVNLEAGPGDLSSSNRPCLFIHARMYALAVKYRVPSMKHLAKERFESTLACCYDAPDLAQAIEEVYHATDASDRCLRDIVLQAFRCHPQLAIVSDIYEVIKATPQLAFELYKVERGWPI